MNGSCANSRFSTTGVATASILIVILLNDARTLLSTDSSLGASASVSRVAQMRYHPAEES